MLITICDAGKLLPEELLDEVKKNVFYYYFTKEDEVLEKHFLKKQIKDTKITPENISLFVDFRIQPEVKRTRIPKLNMIFSDLNLDYLCKKPKIRY